MIATLPEIQAFAEERFTEANVASKAIHFSLNEKYAKSGRETGSIRASAIVDDPKFSQLQIGFGMSAWAVVLAVDLRKSSDLAIRLGAEKTYLTMHTYMPTMAHLISRAGGKVVGLRGDGMFGAFGLTEDTGSNNDITSDITDGAIRSAVKCGKAMLEAVEDAINFTLQNNDVEGDLKIGVGISFGQVVVTRIGWDSANELTTYGSPVNQACKLSDKGCEVLLTPGAEALYPVTANGTMRFRSHSDGFIVKYPPGYYGLDRPARRIRPR